MKHRYIIASTATTLLDINGKVELAQDVLVRLDDAWRRGDTATADELTKYLDSVLTEIRDATDGVSP